MVAIMHCSHTALLEGVLQHSADSDLHCQVKTAALFRRIKLMLSMKYGNLLLYDIILHVIYQKLFTWCWCLAVILHISSSEQQKLTLLLVT